MRWHWWTVIALGLAVATKWSGLYFLTLFAVIAIYRVFTHHTGRDLIKPTLRTFAQYSITPVAIYFASWTGWFLSSRGWARDHSASALNSFLHYHSQMLGFHTGLVEKHAYQANPWSWIVMGRPTSFYYQSPKGCGAENCAQEVLALGTPFLWWIGTIAVAVIFGFWIRSLAQKLYEPQLNIIVVGITAGYLPWFFFQERTVFSFYAIVFQPFIILAILYCAYIALIHFKNSRNTYIFIALVGAVIFLNFIYFLPIFIADVITYEAWRARMWLPSWI